MTHQRCELQLQDQESFNGFDDTLFGIIDDDSMTNQTNFSQISKRPLQRDETLIWHYSHIVPQTNFIHKFSKRSYNFFFFGLLLLEHSYKLLTINLNTHFQSCPCLHGHSLRVDYLQSLRLIGKGPTRNIAIFCHYCFPFSLFN